MHRARLLHACQHGHVIYIYNRYRTNHAVNVPMLTSLIFSEAIKSRATLTFSSFWARSLALLFERFIFFWERTSKRFMSRNPSLNSTSRSSMMIPWCRRCSLHQRVKVFCWTSFHSASMTALWQAEAALCR